MDDPALVSKLTEEVKRLRGVVEAFAETAEHAVRAFESRGKGGQSCGPFHGDFANIMPSTVGQLRWWAKRMREVLK